MNNVTIMRNNPEEKRYKVPNIEALPEVAHRFIEDWKGETHFVLVGEMGAGKTTFIKAICKTLGVTDSVSSPTFSIANEYTTEKGDTLYHFDFYRIEDEEEALDFGIEEYFESGALCFMEWAERIENLLPDTFVEVKITELDGRERGIRVRKI